ncbi:MAG: PDZ domain-containing protein [Candidatus Omnitrophota bacterium]
MKNAKCVFGIIVIGFCLLFINTRISAADSPQLPWRTTVWPALSSTQWYWYEPQTNLTVEQVDAIFKEVAATNILLIDYLGPGHNVAVGDEGVEPYVKLEIEKPKKGKEADKGSLEPEQVAIRMVIYWTKFKSKGDSFSVPLNIIQEINLKYISDANNKWCLGMSAGVGSGDLYIFYFKNEDFARRFGNAVASFLAQKGFILKLSKLGLSYSDLTPAQAEALGKTRIDNVLVTLVAIDGPADKANIQPLDVITEVNGVKVRNLSHFSSLMEGIASGTKITLTCLRRTEVVEKDQKQFDWKPIVIEVTAK